MTDVETLEESRALRDGLQDTLRGVAATHPFEPVLDRDGLDRPLWEAIGSGGWFGVAEEDGIGSSASVLVVLAQEVGARLVPGPFSATMALAVPLLARGGPSPIEVASVVAGTALVSVALPAGGTPRAPTWAALVATEESDGRLRLRGRLPSVVAASGADAVLVPFVRRDEGVAVAVLSTAADGVTIDPAGRLDLAKPVGTVDVEAWITSDDLLGGWDARHADLLAHWLARYQLCISGELVGAAEEMVSRTVTYVSERRQFGVPVGSFQAVKHLVAEAHAEVELARALLDETASRVDDASADVTDADLASCHLVCSRAARRVVDWAVQAHGGMGFTWDHGFQYRYRQALYAEQHPFPARVLRHAVWAALHTGSGLDQRPRESS